MVLMLFSHVRFVPLCVELEMVDFVICKLSKESVKCVMLVLKMNFTLNRE